MRKIQKFKEGDKVYVKRQSGIVFGEIVRANITEIVSYRTNRINPKKLRLSRRIKIKYLIKFDEPIQDKRRKETAYWEAGKRPSMWVSQSSIKLIPTDESELVRRLIGEDYL